MGNAMICNISAEMALIGSVLIDTDTLREVVSIVDEKDFAMDAHLHIWTSIRSLYNQGKGIDAIVLADDLTRRGLFDVIGGEETLIEIVNSAGRPENAKYYAGVVREKSIKRGDRQVCAKGYHGPRAEEIVPKNPVIDYETYLASPEWQIKREAMRWLAGYRCQVCNRHKDEVILNTHHRTYERLGNEVPGDLIVLCRACHDIFHAHGKLAR